MIWVFVPLGIGTVDIDEKDTNDRSIIYRQIMGHSPSMI